ncbi:hypothetical protein Tco_0446017 [Tanacetum coccineum]
MMIYSHMKLKFANIPYDSKMDDDSEHEADGVIWDMIRLIEDDEVELTNKESSDYGDEIVEVFRIEH